MGSAHRFFNVSIVGLSVGTTVLIRNCLTQIVPDVFELAWVNLIDTNVHLLIVNSVSVDSPHVFNLLGQRNLPMLKVSAEIGREGSLQNDTLYLPVDDLSSLQDWLFEHVPVLSSLTAGELLQQVPAALTNQHVDFSLFERMHDRQAGPIKLSRAEGLIGVINPQKEQIFLSKSLQPIKQVDHSWSSTYSTNRDSREIDLTPYDLRQWIWQILWGSSQPLTLAGGEDYIRLKFWPQPGLQDRRDILRMAACFEGGARVCDVAENNNLPLTLVQHFASSLIAANLAEQILAEAVIKRDTSEGGFSGLKSLFSKLRNRLGL